MSVATLPTETRYGFKPKRDDLSEMLQFRIPGFNNETTTPFSWCKSHVKGFAVQIQQLLSPTRKDDVRGILQKVVQMFNDALNRPEAPWIANKSIDPADPFLGTRQDEHVQIIPVTKSAD